MKYESGSLRDRLRKAVEFIILLSSILAGGLLLTWNLTLSFLWAAEPPSGTLTDTATERTWAGAALTSTPAFDPANCRLVQSCDLFTLTIAIPDAYRSAHPNFVVFVRIDWDSPTNDYDLYVRKDGQPVADSAQGFTTFEEVRLDHPANGIYQVFAHSFATVPNTRYTGRATLQAEPPVVLLRQGIYQRDPDGKFGPQMFQFTSDLRLIGASDLRERSQGVEPAIAVNPFGTIFVSAIQGALAGTDFWRSRDGGQSFQYLGQPDGVQSEELSRQRLGFGGGDNDLSLGAPFLSSDPETGGGTGLVYLSSLWLGSVTMAVSSDEGDSFLTSQSDVPLVDREWNASVGTSRLYLTSRQLGVLITGTTSLTVVQSDDGGLTYPRGGFITTLTRAPRERLQGNIVAYPAPGDDPPNSTLYNIFSGPSRRELYLAKCPAPCQLPLLVQGLPDPSQRPFAVRQIFMAPPGSSVDNVFPVIAADNGGGVHVAFSDKRRIFLMSSPDGGDTWTNPVQVNNPSDPETATALMPWIVAGDFGRVGVIWYGSDRVGNADSEAEFRGAEWKMFYAVTTNAFDDSPRFGYVVASGTITGSDQQRRGVVHVGSICTQGLACDTSTPCGNRNLAEYSSVTGDPNGFANIAFSGDVSTSNGLARTHYTRQVAGDTLLDLTSITGAGSISDGPGEKNVGFKIYGDLGGQFSYLDKAARLYLKGKRFASVKQEGDRVSFSGTGLLQDGSEVSFTVAVTNTNAATPDAGNFSIVLDTGYSASGVLKGSGVTIDAASKPKSP